MTKEKLYIEALIEAGDRRSHNELAADLQLFRHAARFAGKDWRWFEDKTKNYETISTTTETESNGKTVEDSISD